MVVYLKFRFEEVEPGEGLKIVNETKGDSRPWNSFFQNYKLGSSRAVNFSSNTCIFYSGMLLLKRRGAGRVQKGIV